MKMHLNRVRNVMGVAAVATATTLALVAPAAAHAAPTSGWTFTVSSAPAGLKSGSELALDSGSHDLFITDADSAIGSRGGTNFSINTKPTNPKVAVFDIDTRRTTRTISFAGQPLGVLYAGPVPLMPINQVPDGIALDTKRHRVVTSNSHANGISIFPMNARTTGPANLISVPGGHPMGIAINEANGIAYVALNYINQLAMVDTNTRREIRRIPTFAPSFVDLDTARHRLYIGNADNDKRNNYLAVLDIRTNTIIKKIPTPANARPKVDPVTGRIYAGSFDTGKVLVIDPQTLRVIKTIETNGSPNKLAIDAQRRLIYLSNLQKRSLTVISLDTNQVITTVPVNAPIHSIVVDPRTGTVYGTQHQAGNLSIIKPVRR